MPTSGCLRTSLSLRRRSAQQFRRDEVRFSRSLKCTTSHRCLFSQCSTARLIRYESPPWTCAVCTHIQAHTHKSTENNRNAETGRGHRTVIQSIWTVNCMFWLQSCANASWSGIGTYYLINWTSKQQRARGSDHISPHAHAHDNICAHQVAVAGKFIREHLISGAGPGLVMLSLELAKSNAKAQCWQVGLQLIMQFEPTPLLRALPIGLLFE